jgi:molybdopterin synthase catalytic subunit
VSGFEVFEIRDAPLDIGELAASLADGRAGAFVSFEGRVRNTSGGRVVVGLEYEAYPRLCLAEGTAVVREALGGVIASGVISSGVIVARCVHRVGRLSIGDIAVWVGVIAGHRDEAFSACRFIIDEVKRRVPIWKKEHFADGSSAWVGIGAELHSIRG